MISPGCAVFGAHALLDYGPFLVFCYEEGVVVELVACLDGCVVDFGGYFACVSEGLDAVF